MKLHSKVSISILFVLVLVGALVSITYANNYPSAPIHVIISSGIGGSVDTTIRALQPKIEEKLGVKLIIECNETAGGREATLEVFRAKPDGYTILASACPGIHLGQVLYDPKYDIAKMKHLAAWSGGDARAITIAIDSPYETWDDIVRASKEKTIFCGGTGVGSVSSLQSGIMSEIMGLKHEYVSYESGSLTVKAVASGEIDLGFSSQTSAIRRVQSGLVDLFATFSTEINPDYPNATPLGKEYPDAVFASSIGAFAPPDTPDEIVEKLEEAFVYAANSQEYSEFAKKAGIPYLVRNSTEWHETSIKYIKLCEDSKALIEAQMNK